MQTFLCIALAALSVLLLVGHASGQARVQSPPGVLLFGINLGGLLKGAVSVVKGGLGLGGSSDNSTAIATSNAITQALASVNAVADSVRRTAAQTQAALDAQKAEIQRAAQAQAAAAAAQAAAQQKAQQAAQGLGSMTPLLIGGGLLVVLLLSRARR